MCMDHMRTQRSQRRDELRNLGDALSTRAEVESKARNVHGACTRGQRSCARVVLMDQYGSPGGPVGTGQQIQNDLFGPAELAAVAHVYNGARHRSATRAEAGCATSRSAARTPA